MIRLDRTNRTLGIVLGGAVATNQLNVIVSGIERGPSSASTQVPVIGFTQIATTNGATDVTICAAPGVTGRVREIESIYFRNRDTAAVTVSIEYDDNGTDYVLYSATLAVGDFVAYSYNSGWQLFDTNGNAKTLSGIAIGSTVAGGTATRVLFIGAGPALDDDAELTYNDTTNVLTVNGSTFGTNTQVGGTLGVTGAVTFSTPLPLTGGGTNASLTASVGGIFYSTASAGAILAGTATAGQVLRSGASAAPTWSTATYPSTATATGTILRADGTNWVATTATYPTTVTDDQVLYGTATNVVGGSANLLFDGTTLTANTLTVSTGNLTVSVGTIGLSTDVLLARDAANILAQKNAANAQALRIYGTTTGPRYLELSHNGTDANIYTQSGHLRFSAGGINFWNILSSGPLQPVVANSYDLGDSTNTVRTGYFGTSMGIIGTVSGTGVLAVGNGTPPTAQTDTVGFYSSDIAAGHTEPSFFCEGTQVLATGQADSASSVRVKMRINGTDVTLLAI